MSPSLADIPEEILNATDPQTMINWLHTKDLDKYTAMNLLNLWHHQTGVHVHNVHWLQLNNLPEQ